jgi:hypothetical protein
MPTKGTGWWEGFTFYTGEEMKEELRKKYGLPDDWEPDEGEPLKWGEPVIQEPSISPAETPKEDG